MELEQINSLVEKIDEETQPLMFNEPLLQQVWDTVQKLETPHMFDWTLGFVQGAWRCNTGMCVAGHTTQLLGREWIEPASNAYAANYVKATQEEIDRKRTYKYVASDGMAYNAIDCASVARDALGIDAYDARILFKGTNTLKDLEWMFEALLKGEHLEVADWDEEDVEELASDYAGESG